MFQMHPERDQSTVLKLLYTVLYCTPLQKIVNHLKD